MEQSGKLTDRQIDALKEIGNIGVAHAATALSQLVGRKVEVFAPVADVISRDEIPKLIGLPEELVVASYSKLMGDVRGRILLLFPKESALNLIDIVLKHPAGTTQFLSEMDFSTLKEEANILVGAFLTALGEFLGISFMPTTPKLSFDQLSSIIKYMMVESGAESEHLLCIYSKFQDTSAEISGKFLVLFDREFVNFMLKKIETKMGHK